MASLLDLTGLVDSNIRNKTPLVLKVEHANVEQAIINELFNSEVFDNQTSQIYTTKTAQSTDFLINYSLTIQRSGNRAIVKMKFTRNNAQGITPAPGGLQIFTWKNTPYKPKDIVNNITFKAYDSVGNLSSTFLINEVGVYLKGIFPLGNVSLETCFLTYITYS